MGLVLGFYSDHSNLFLFVAINALLALSIYITLSAGLLSLGNAAFMGIGAYSSALLTLKLGWSFPAALAAGTLGAGIVGLLLGLPVLRLRGIFLAIATLGFGEVVRIIGLNWELTGEALGLNGIPVKTQLWQVLLTLVALSCFFIRLDHSRAGRALKAIREDEAAARTMGIDTVYYKNFAFVVGALLAGLAGGFSAHQTHFISPADFGFATAVNILIYAIVGGIGSFWGPMIGALLLTVLPEALRFLADYRLIFNGLVLLAIIVFLPEGLVSVVSARRRKKPMPEPAELGLAAPAASSQPGRMPSEGEPILRVSGLSCSFGGIRALDGLSFEVSAGGIFGLIGPNGAGKTTVLNALSGLIRPNAGTISFRGSSIEHLPSHRIAQLGITRTFQNIKLFRGLEAEENVLVGEHLQARASLAETLLLAPRARAEERSLRAQAHKLLALTGLSGKAGLLAGELSYGDQRRLEIARALGSEPALLLLDEPAAGMNHAEVADLARLIRDLASAGHSILLVEHHMGLVMGVCQRVAVLNFGVKIAEGSPAELASNPVVIEAYLGRD